MTKREEIQRQFAEKINEMDDAIPRVTAISNYLSLTVDEMVKFTEWLSENSYCYYSKSVWYRNFGKKNYESHTTRQLVSLYLDTNT